MIGKMQANNITSTEQATWLYQQNYFFYAAEPRRG
jgi:hypothetical protein